MDKNFEEINKLEEIRNKILNITEQLSVDIPVFNIMKNNPVAATGIMIAAGFFAAFISKKVVKSVLILISYGLKIATFFYFIKQGKFVLSRLKKFRR